MDYDYELLIAGSSMRTPTSHLQAALRELCATRLATSCSSHGRSIRPMSCAAWSSPCNLEKTLVVSSEFHELLKPEHVTIAVTKTPFAAAIAASRGEEPQDVDAWLGDIEALLSGGGAEVETVS